MIFEEQPKLPQFPAEDPSWSERQITTYGPRVLHALCKTVPLISHLSIEQADLQHIDAKITCSASLPKSMIQRIAEITAATSGISIKIDYTILGSHASNRNVVCSPPLWRIVPARDFCEAINAFDCREIDLAAASLCRIEPAPLAPIEQLVEFYRTELEKIEELSAIKIDPLFNTVTLQLNLTIERLIELSDINIFNFVAAALPDDWNLLVETLKHESIKRIEPQLPIAFEDREHRDLVRNSLIATLKSKLPAFEVNDHSDGFEVLIPLSKLPDRARGEIESLLSKFGVPVFLHDATVLARKIEAAELPGIVNFLLPEGIFFRRVRDEQGPLTLCLGRLRRTSIPSNLSDQISAVLQQPIAMVSEIFDKPLEDVLRRCGKALQSILAQVADNDGVVRVSYNKLRDLVVETLFKPEQIQIRVPSGAQLLSYPKLSKQFVALGAANSLHEDAFHIERTFDGFKLDIALIDGSAFVPHELGIYYHLQDSFSSAYSEKERFDLLPRQQLEQHAGYKIGEYRPSVVITFHVDPDGEFVEAPTLKLARVSIAAEFDRQNFGHALECPENSVELQCQLFDRLSFVLRDKRLFRGGLIWRNPAGEVFESQLLANHFLADYAAQRSIPYLNRVLDTPTVEQRKQYADDIYAQFGGYLSEVVRDLPAHTLASDKKFRRYLQSVSSKMSNREIKDLCGLLRNRHYFHTDTTKTDFFQLGRRYSQSSGSLRYFPALINIGQISRSLRGQPLYDQSAMMSFAAASTVIQNDSRLLSKLLSIQSFVGEVVLADISPGGSEARPEVSPGLAFALVDTDSKRSTLSGRQVKSAIIDVVGYDLKSNRGLARVVAAQQPG